MSEISIWYVSNLQRCNFTCSYCASSQPTRQQDPRQPTWTLGQDVHDRIVDWLGTQDLTLRLRMNSIGEPFASREYLDSVARLTRARNLSLVEILSNGSFRPQQFDRFAAECDLEKLSLWITFHHEFTSPRSLVEAAQHARSRGAFVVVNAIVFPDNVAAVDELLRRCAELELPIATGLGLNFNNAYPDQGFTPATSRAAPRALELANLANPLGKWHELSAAPAGRPCAAGGSYFYVQPNGDVFACRTYATGKRESRLGSALDEQFRVQPRSERYQACRAAGRCNCPEDYQNLEAILSRFSWPERSFCLPVARSAAGEPARKVDPSQTASCYSQSNAPQRARTRLPLISDAP